MALAPGSKLGPYEVLSLLGAGGMGEVYRARDPRLNRDVAIKVLPADRMADESRRRRFVQEARAASALNHPNIVTVHEINSVDGVDFIVLELAQGPTLRDTIPRDGMRLHQVLRVAIPIADALARAHAAGIVHCDLKPGNVIVSADGMVKVLDFGLARLVTPRDESEPTETYDGAPTVAGTIGYMSPEQVAGGALDARTDVFSFGALLYEMTTGRRAFAGRSSAEALAAVIKEQPPAPSEVVRDLPKEFERLIQRCLRKEPGRRFQSMADVRLDLEQIEEDSRSQPSLVPIAARWRRAVPWAIAAIFGVGWVLLLWRVAPWRTTPPRTPLRLSVELGVDSTLPTTDAAFVLSPDGTLLAFVARRSGSDPQLYLRRLDQLTATSLGGTDGASSPFFSPDGQWVAFFAGQKLKKVPVTGGAVVVIADAPDPRGGWWAEDGTIVYAPGHRVGLMRVSAVGGEAHPLTTLAKGEITHRWPQVLPGGAAVLYTASTEINIGAGSTLVAQPLPSGERVIVQRGGYFGRYVASGHVIFMQEDTLFAMPFDRQRLTATGALGRVIDGVRSNSARGAAQFAVSEVGTLAYLPGRNTFDARTMVWVDRTGAITALRAVATDWSNPEFSPDGRRIAMDIRGEGHRDIWVYDWTRETMTRVTSEGTNEAHPVWTPDGVRIVYRSFRSATDPSGNTLSWKRADGSGDTQVLLQSQATLIPGSWHPTSKVLAYVATMPGTGDDVMMLPVDGDEVTGWKPGQPTGFVNTAAREQDPAFSPNGEWLSYSSNESGEDQVYVRRFPGPSERVMVSSAGGDMSSWSRTRPELVFSGSGLDYRHPLMVTPYRVENDSFRVDKPRLWAERAPTLREILGERLYALHPDGVRVVIAPPSEGEAVGQNRVTFFLNFFDELQRIAPAKP
jgi:serine/threonine protein kinase/Tol biopolymer transport system component